MDILCWKGWGLKERGRCDCKGSSVPRLSHHGQPILWRGDTSLVLVKLTSLSLHMSIWSSCAGWGGILGRSSWAGWGGITVPGLVLAAALGEAGIS